MKTNPGRFFEDYTLGETIAHAVPRTVSGGERALYHALYPARGALYSSDEFARSCGLAAAPLDDAALPPPPADSRLAGLRPLARPEAILAADEMSCALSDYPVLDESHFSELEWAEAESQWEMMPLKYRVELCAEAGVSIFAARRDSIPSEDSGYIFERCAGV